MSDTLTVNISSYPSTLTANLSTVTQTLSVTIADNTLDFLNGAGLDLENVFTEDNTFNKSITVKGSISASHYYGLPVGDDVEASTKVRASSGDWDSTYTTVQANSALWIIDSGDDVEASTKVRASSAYWDSVYTTVQANSATNWNYQGTDLKGLSANWESTSTTVRASSANWNNAYKSLSSLSGSPIGTQSTLNYTQSDTSPPSPKSGDQWLRTSTGQKFEFYDGFWIDVTGGGVSQGTIQTAISSGDYTFGGKVTANGQGALSALGNNDVLTKSLGDSAYPVKLFSAITGNQTAANGGYFQGTFSSQVIPRIILDYNPSKIRIIGAVQFTTTPIAAATANFDMLLYVEDWSKSPLESASMTLPCISVTKAAGVETYVLTFELSRASYIPLIANSFSAFGMVQFQHQSILKNKTGGSLTLTAGTGYEAGFTASFYN